MKFSVAPIRARVLSACLVFGAIAAAAMPVRADEKASIESILTRAAAGDEDQNLALGKQLADLGAQFDPSLFDEISKECATPKDSSSPRLSVLLSAFEWMGPQRWRPLLIAKLGTGGNVDAIGAIFAIARRCGDTEEVPFILYAAGFDQEALRRTELEQAVTSILVRHAAAFESVDRALAGLVPDLRSSMIRSVEATKCPRAALLLARWIESRRDMRFECLPHLSRLSLSLEKPLPPEVIAPVRALVEGGDELTLDEALLCDGRLGDYDAIPALIRHLKEGSYSVRAGAHWALQSITRLQLGKDPSAWTGWFETESRWWNNDSRQAFMQLVHGSKAEKIEVLRQVSILHAWRDKAATEMAIALDDADEDVATLTANELRRLDSRLAVPALVDALFGGRPRVADAARAALQSITKRELPIDPLAVREALVPTR